MELKVINNERYIVINSDEDSIISKNTNKNNIENVIITKKSRKCKNIPFLIYPILIVILLVIISLIIYIIFNSKYKITYIYDDNPYDKPTYSTHNYSSITFLNGLKVVLVQVDSDDEEGASIVFDYGYLDNKYEPGYIRLAFLSLISDNMTNSDVYINYLGYYFRSIEQFYSTFFFHILSGGFQQYLKIFSELTYLEQNDNRTKKIYDKDLSLDEYLTEKQNHLLEYLVYGYKNNSEDMIPQGDNITKNSISNESISNIMKLILSDPSKIKIVLYSHYNLPLMKKIFLRYFNNISNAKASDNNNINQLNAYNLSNFTTNKIIYYKIDDDENNFIEINYFLNKNNNIKYNQLIKDSQYLLFIDYILNQKDEGSLYYELNNGYNNISIKSLSSDFEVILKSRIKFTILIYLNHYSYYYINEIIETVYNYMNNIKLYINSLNNNSNDIRIDELDKKSEQNFTFTEDEHNFIFFNKLTNELFYKDEKDFLLKQMWFTKNDFMENITKVKFYFNQLIINNSVILLGLNDKATSKYKQELSKISYIFNNIKNTIYFNLTYSEHKISDHINITFDNDTTKISNQTTNKFLSKFNKNIKLEYDESEKENFFNVTHKEINESTNYLKVFWRNVTIFRTPKVFVTIYFIHPFLRPNFLNDTNIPSQNDKLYFYYLLYFSYIERCIYERLADAFRAGENYYYISFNENSFFLDLFAFSDIVNKCLEIIKDILSNETNFKNALENKFEIYRDYALEDYLSSIYNTDLDYASLTLTKLITKDSNNNFPSIYNYLEFPKNSFIDCTFNDTIKEVWEKEVSSTLYSIKYIYLFGYFKDINASEVYEIFKSENKFNIPLEYANFDNKSINDKNFVEKVLERKKFEKTQNASCDFDYKKVYRSMYFSTYGLNFSCLADVLEDILSDEKKFKEKIDYRMVALKKKNIYLIYPLMEAEENNTKFIENIFKFLEKDTNMRKVVDVIGDKFYYKFEGYKKLTILKINNMAESGWTSAYDSFYGYISNNDILNFDIESYDVFIKMMKDFINGNHPFIDLYNKSNNTNF